MNHAPYLIQPATTADIPALLQLINSAYRGPASTKGWTTEAHIIAGDSRINAEGIAAVIEREGSVLLKVTNLNQQIVGCVNLQQKGEGLYLGMLCVDPNQQGGGIGKQLLQAACNRAQELNCSHIEMTVISLRTELIDWYKRHGYQETGELIPFEEDEVSGKHLQKLHFIKLIKPIS